MSQVFTLTASQMLMLMLFFACGYALARSGVMPKDEDAVLAKLTTYIILPAMIISNFSKHCTPGMLKAEGPLLLVSVVCCAACTLLSYPLSALFAQPGEVRNVYRYSFSITNMGYLGNVVIANVFGEEMLFHFLMFGIPFTFVAYTWGVRTLTAEYGPKKFTWKQLLQPILIALVVGMLIGLLQIPLPGFVIGAIDSASACLGPVAMLLTGIVIANFHWRDLLGDWRVYIASGIRLLALPVVFTLTARAFGVTGAALVCVLAAIGMPFGLNSVIFPAAYGGDERPGASMVVISHVLSVITVPILFALFFGQ